MAKPKGEPKGEPKGATGTAIIGGVYLDRDKKDVFRNRRQFGSHTEYGDLDEMLATDIIIKMLMRAVADVIYQATKEIICPEGCDQEAADLVEKQLFFDLEQDFGEFVREAAMGAPWYGHLPFEEEWAQMPDGSVAIRRFHARYPWTIQKWDVQKGRLRGIVQWTLKDGQWGHFPIPARDLTLFVQEQQGDDFRGSPWGRSIHPLWTTKQRLMLCRLVGHNRNASGVPWASYEGEDMAPGDDDEKEIADFLQYVQMHEQSHLVMPPGWVPHWFINEFWAPQAEQIREDINSINGEILLGFRAAMMGLGIIGEGSRAVGTVQEDGYLKVLEGVAKMIASTLNGTSGADHTGVVKRIVDRNIPGYAESGKKYPYMTFGGIRVKRLAEIMEGLASYATAGGIMSRRVHDIVFNLLGLDSVSDEEWDEAAEAKETTEQDGKDKVDRDGNPIKADEKDPPEKGGSGEPDEDEERLALAQPGIVVRHRPLLPIENFVPLSAIEGEFKLGVLKYEALVFNAIQSHADRIGAAGEESIQEMRGAIDAMTAGIREGAQEIAFDLARFGVRTVSEERDLQKAVGFDAAKAEAEATQEALVRARRNRGTFAEGDVQDVLGDLDINEIEDLADMVAEDIRGKSMSLASAARAVRGVGVAERIAIALRAMSAAQMRAGGFGLTTMAFSMGRRTFAEAFKHEIRNVTISEVLDQLTCSPCEGHDGLVVQFGSPEHEAHSPPYHLCEGGMACREIEIFNFSGRVG